MVQSSVYTGFIQCSAVSTCRCRAEEGWLESRSEEVAAFQRPGQDCVHQHWGVRSAEGGRIQLGGRGVKYVEIFGGVKDFRVIENVKVEEEGGGVVGDDVRRARRLGKVGAADDL